MATTLNIEINQPFEVAYEYLQNPLNLADWVSFFEEIRQDENGLTAQTPLGTCELAFVAPNEYGVLDHVLRDSQGHEYYYPMRAVHWADKTLLTFTTPESQPSVIEAVEADLARLKEVLEK